MTAAPKIKTSQVEDAIRAQWPNFDGPILEDDSHPHVHRPQWVALGEDECSIEPSNPLGHRFALRVSLPPVALGHLPAPDCVVDRASGPPIAYWLTNEPVERAIPMDASADVLRAGGSEGLTLHEAQRLRRQIGLLLEVTNDDQADAPLADYAERIAKAAANAKPQPWEASLPKRWTGTIRLTDPDGKAPPFDAATREKAREWATANGVSEPMAALVTSTGERWGIGRRIDSVRPLVAREWATAPTQWTKDPERWSADGSYMLSSTYVAVWTANESLPESKWATDALTYGIDGEALDAVRLGELDAAAHIYTAAEIAELKAQPAEAPNRLTIKVGADLGRMVDATHDALERRGGVYVRDASGDSPSPVVVRDGRIRRLTQRAFQVEVARASRWEGKKGAQKPDRDAVLSAYDTLYDAGLAQLAAVSDVPLIRPDGTIVAAPGYDAASKVYLTDAVGSYCIPREPTEADARAALEVLRDPIAGFPFCTERDDDGEPVHVHEAAMLGAMLTAVGRHAIEGPVPLHMFDAPKARSGKTKLAQIVSVLAGADGQVQGLNLLRQEESEKAIATCTREAAPAYVIDNSRSGVTIRSETLCAVLTAWPTFSGRVLGASENFVREVRTLFLLTGNNIAVGGDLPGRTIPIRIDPGTEKPEARRFNFDPVKRVRDNRTRFVEAGLTILAWHLQTDGELPDGLTPMGSFEAWSDVIRGAVYRLTGADPLDAQRSFQSVETDANAVGVLLAALAKRWPEGFLARDLADAIVTVFPNPDPLRDLYEALPSANLAKVSARTVGAVLREYRESIYNGHRLTSETDRSKTSVWRVEVVSAT